VLISTDEAFYRKQRAFLKPGQLPKTFNTPFRHGCPYDCGLCPDHEQHSCLSWGAGCTFSLSRMHF
jgi:uncharacterized radical SAM superfamily Fe-S cluster-containing enzyme